MVQISLRKVGCLAGLLMLVMLAGAFLVLFTDLDRHDHVANVRGQPDPLDVAELDRLSPPERVALDSAQLSELKRIYSDIVQAYSNRQVEVLREWRGKLPGRVERVRQNDFDDVERHFFRIVYDESCTKLNKILGEESIGEEYRNAADFEQHVDTLITLVLIYGDIQSRRRCFGGLFEDIEAFMYYRLKSYRDGFHAQGRTDLEEAAERALARWIDQIESENGYTRACLVFDIAGLRVQGDKLMASYGQTWEEMSQTFVRMATHTLTWAGYTPKWLDKFKNIPRHATAKEGQL